MFFALDLAQAAIGLFVALGFGALVFSNQPY
jgi:hypothetical protein